ncbi:hydrogenase nickel incorporation protein HypB [Nocardia sp. CA-119907]|uniref:hydrogenase nickel incorporation protein HypB n=1 Tax=Nocardia sp. CA-119907 TaxID=3239973 RepID=UPI003D962EDE
MCATCGCGEHTAGVITIPHEHPHQHSHSDEHVHEHEHEHDVRHGGDHVHLPVTDTVTLEQKVLAKNDQLAQQNRIRIQERDILALNMTSSPGAGKTTLLVRTVTELREMPMAVIEGDQETLLDAERIAAAGCRAVQINTGAGCHLDAEMVRHALDVLDPDPGSVLFVENVGNLVCPALFDLGEHGKVVVISVTEGSDKPLKYPHMFAAANLVIVNKIDLLPFVDFDLDQCRAYAHRVNPGLEFITLSAATGEGVSRWYEWLSERRRTVSSPIEGTVRQA